MVLVGTLRVIFCQVQLCFSKPIEIFLLDKEINVFYSKASEKAEEHIKTHSFRGIIITNLLKETPIDNLKDVVEHKYIQRTALYKKK